ncbi:hypothetical protein SFUMM280S_09080 [Streptomyces fumanus]
MSSSRPPSGIGKRRAASVRATATGSVSSSSTAPSRIRPSSARVSSSRAVLTSAASGPSPMPSTRREKAYSADIARRLGVGSSLMPYAKFRACCPVTVSQ